MRDGTLVIAHTNADRSAINREIHQTLKANGELGASEVVVPILVREKTTGSQLNNAANYLDHVGQLLLMRDTYYAIEGVDTQAKTVALRAIDSTTGEAGGASVVMSPAEHRSSDIALYRQDSIRVSEGEKLRFTATNKDEGIFANRPYSVVEITPDKALVLQDRDGERLTVQPQALTHRHVDYAYTVTAYGAHQFTQDNKDTGVIVRLQGDATPLNVERLSGGSLQMSEKQLQELVRQMNKEDRHAFPRDADIDREQLLREKNRQPQLSEQEIKDFIRQEALATKALEKQTRALAISQSKEDLQTMEREITIVPDRIKEKTL